jgi:hypothetical protein
MLLLQILRNPIIFELAEELFDSAESFSTNALEPLLAIVPRLSISSYLFIPIPVSVIMIYFLS